MKRSISEVSEQLQGALAEQAKHHKALEAAQEQLRPLEVAAQGSNNAVATLIKELNKLTGVTEETAAPGRKKRGGVPGPRKGYYISPENKVIAAEKRTYTRAINAGKNKATATKLAKEAANVLKKKLGL